MEVSSSLVVFLSAQIFGILSVVFVLSYALSTESSIFDQNNVFKWHPVLMTLGMIYFMGTSIMMYRGLHWMNKPHLKIIHGAVHLCGLIFSLVGVSLMIDFKINYDIIHFESLHSLFGLIAFILFGLQWIAGLILYLVPQTPIEYRQMAMPFHVVIGTLTLILGSSAAITGVAGASKSSTRSTTSVVAAFAGFFILTFLLITIYYTRKEKFKRDSSND